MPKPMIVVVCSIIHRPRDDNVDLISAGTDRQSRGSKSADN